MKELAIQFCSGSFEDITLQHNVEERTIRKKWFQALLVMNCMTLTTSLNFSCLYFSYQFLRSHHLLSLVQL